MEPKQDLACRKTNEKLKPFLEDLLTEEEFHAFAVHLEQCEHCLRIARGVGSLSNDIRELGKVPVPDDFVSTVLHKFTAGPEEKTPQNNSGKWRIAAIVAGMIVFLLLPFGIARYYHLKQRVENEKKRQPVAVAVPASAAAIPLEEIHGYLEKLKELADSLEGEENGAAAREPSGMQEEKDARASGMGAVPETNDKFAPGSARASGMGAVPETNDKFAPGSARASGMGAVPETNDKFAPGSARASGMGAVPETNDKFAPGSARAWSEGGPAHWHIGYRSLDEKRKLASALRIMHARQHAVNPDLFLLSLTQAESRRLRSEVYYLSRQASPIVEFAGRGAGNHGEEKKFISVLLAGEDESGIEKPLHWHIRLTMSNHDDLINRIRRSSRFYEEIYSSLLLVSMPAAEVEGLQKDIQRMPGVLADFGETDGSVWKEREALAVISVFLAEEKTL